MHLRPIFSKTRTGRHSRRIYSSPLPTPLGIFAKEVRDDDLPEYEHRVSPTHSLLPPYAAVSGGCQLARAWCERSPNVRRKVDALDGGVTGSRALKGRSKCSRNMFPIIVYAFTAHNHRVTHRRVRNGRPRQAARSVAVPSPAAASTGLSVRRRASTEHLGSAPGGPSQPPCPAFTP